VSEWGPLVAYAAMLPLLYVVARRRSSKISLKAPVIIALTVIGGGVIALCALRGVSVSYGIALAFACLVICTASDLATGLIFDGVTVGAACGIGMCCLLAQTAPAALAGAGICIIPLLALYAVTRGRGIGLGDVKLGGIVGAGVGGIEALGAIGIAFVVGAICCVPLLVARRVRRGDRVAFAPFLALGTIAFVAGRLVQAHG
jgi:leader peptidase (prepilin peptidase) / N-methyltransferase